MANTNTTFSGYPTEADFLEAIPYHYVPTTWICIVFLVLFSLTTSLHLAQGIWFRMWWTLPTSVMAGIGEVIGWAARLWSSKNPLKLEPFMIQMSSTIIAPTPLLATNFLILSLIIGFLGPQYSRLSPKWYSIIFCGADVIALCVQGFGGAKASHAVSNNENPWLGGRIMLGGIVIQMVSLIFYATLAAEFLIRYKISKPVRTAAMRHAQVTRRLKFQLIGLGIMTLVIFIRTVYRTTELTEGWDGRIISTQLYFNVFDGTMIVIAMFTLNLFHPCQMLDLPQKQPDNTPAFDGEFKYFQEPPKAYGSSLVMNHRPFRPDLGHGPDPYAAFSPRRYGVPLEA